MLGLLDQALESCTPKTFAIALDCFATANYHLDASRVTQAIDNSYMETDEQSLARYLYLSNRFSVTQSNLKIKVAEQLIHVVEKPQHCSNAVLAIARQGVDADATAAQLAAKMVTLQARSNP